MIRSRLGCLVVVVGLAAPAAADPPRVDLARCTAFDAQALRKALARELPGDAPPNHFAVIVACPDLVTANLHVEPVPADGPIARSLDLGEVPGDLRIKLLALAIAELVEVASSAAAPNKPRAYGDPRDPTSLSDADPKAPRPDRSPKPRAPSPPSVAAIDPPIVVEQRTTPTPREPITLGPIAGVRVFTATHTMMADLGAELTLPWLRVGARGAVGTDRDALGTLHPWLVTVTAARQLACLGPGCALVRGEAGMVGVVTHASTAATGANASTAYAQASLAVEVHHRFHGWTAAATVDVGYAAGMIARAESRAVSSLAGVVGIASLGARWP